jgi:hypothetical protein
MIVIKKDCSGETFEYELFLDDTETPVLCGDGFVTEEEIIEMLAEFASAITENRVYPKDLTWIKK